VPQVFSAPKWLEPAQLIRWPGFVRSHSLDRKVPRVMVHARDNKELGGTPTRSLNLLTRSEGGDRLPPGFSSTFRDLRRPVLASRGTVSRSSRLAKGMDRAVGAGSARNRAVLKPALSAINSSRPADLFPRYFVIPPRRCCTASRSSGFLVWQENPSRERPGDRE
jgi:hypothetical protein